MLQNSKRNPCRCIVFKRSFTLASPSVCCAMSHCPNLRRILGKEAIKMHFIGRVATPRASLCYTCECIIKRKCGLQQMGRNKQICICNGGNESPERPRERLERQCVLPCDDKVLGGLTLYCDARATRFGSWLRG